MQINTYYNKNKSFCFSKYEGKANMFQNYNIFLKIIKKKYIYTHE